MSFFFFLYYVWFVHWPKQDTLDLSWELFCKGTKFEQLSSQLNSGKKCFVTVIWHLNKFTERMWYQCGKEFQRIESVLGLLYHWFLMCFFTKILTTHAKAFEKAVLLHMWHFFFLLYILIYRVFFPSIFSNVGVLGYLYKFRCCIFN